MNNNNEQMLINNVAVIGFHSQGNSNKIRILTLHVVANIEILITFAAFFVNHIKNYFDG